MRILGRVSVARMATVKPYGWVHASLERVLVGTSFPKWSELDNQIAFITQQLLATTLWIRRQTDTRPPVLSGRTATAPPRIIFGMHRCDLHAVTILDDCLFEGETDSAYRAQRGATPLISVDCVPDEHCFCTSLGTDKVADALQIPPATDNPFHGLKARLIEVIHCIEEAIHVIDDLLLHSFARDHTTAMPKGGGQGIAAVEAPRGMFFVVYSYDQDGRLESADCIVPTAQNLASIEADIETLLPGLLYLPNEELKQRVETLIRAYDPCLSCSTHQLQIAIK